MSKLSFFTLSALFFSMAPLAAAMGDGDAPVWQGQLVKKSKTIKGTISIVEAEGRRMVVLSDDFKTKNGPDLKIVFSPQAFAKINGKNAMDGAVVIAPLKSSSGAQHYALPQDLALDRFKSVLIHCEKYSVLWGGAALD